MSIQVCCHWNISSETGVCLDCGRNVFGPAVRAEDGSISPPQPKPTGRITYAVDDMAAIARGMKSMGLGGDEGAK